MTAVGPGAGVSATPVARFNAKAPRQVTATIIAAAASSRRLRFISSSLVCSRARRRCGTWSTRSRTSSKNRPGMCVGPSMSHRSRTRSMSRSRVMPVLRWRSPGRPPRAQRASRGGHGGDGIGPCPPGCRGSRRSRSGRPSKWRSTSKLAAGRKASEAPLELVAIGHDRNSSVVIGMSTGRTRRLSKWRRSRVASARHARTTRRWSQASNRSGSRSPGRSRQAITSASCRASSARSTSRTIRCASA